MKILHIDIETAPIGADVWGLWQQNVSLSQIRTDPRVLCFVAKWHGEKGVFFHSEPADGRRGMLKAAHALLSEADVVVHYNGERFDVPWLNGEFAREGMGPPAPYRQIDLMKTVKRVFRFPSNKLDYVSGALGVGGKVRHEGHALWVKCINGDERAWLTMARYNKQDVLLLEKLYTKLLPWIPNHPNRLLYSGEATCPRCGSGELRKEGFRYTAVSALQRYKCRQCGSWSSSGKRTVGVDIRSMAA